MSRKKRKVFRRVGDVKIVSVEEHVDLPYVQTLSIPIDSEMVDRVKDSARFNTDRASFLDMDSEIFRAQSTDPALVHSSWIDWLNTSIDIPVNTPLVAGVLNRMTLGDGPEKLLGYLGTMNSLIDRLREALEVPVVQLIKLIEMIGESGLTFESSHALMQFTGRLCKIANEHPLIFKEADMTPNRRAKVVLSVSTLLHRIPEGGGEPIPTEELPQPMDLSALLLAVEYFVSTEGVTLFDSVITVDGTRITVLGIWEAIIGARKNGLSNQSFKRALRRTENSWHLLALMTMARGELTNETLGICLQYPELLHDALGNKELLPNLMREWNEVGRPGTIKQFRELGGSAQAWRTHEAERKPSRPAAAPVAPRIAVRPVASQAQTGRKRHHSNFTDDGVHQDVDFGALCSELNVCACFPDLDEELVRSVLVYGLLQTGDRLATAASLPARNDKKLWAQVKSYVTATSRKQLVKAMRPLCDAHLVSYTGGNYHLARKNPRFPQAYKLLMQLWGLVAKHTP